MRDYCINISDMFDGGFNFVDLPNYVNICQSMFVAVSPNLMWAEFTTPTVCVCNYGVICYHSLCLF